MMTDPPRLLTEPVSHRLERMRVAGVRVRLERGAQTPMP